MSLQFFISSDINLPVAIKIVSFHNVVVPPPKSPLEDLFDFLEEPQLLRETDAQEVYLTLQLLGNNGKPLIPETTVPRIHLREWQRLPIKYRDLPLSAQVVLKIWSCVAPRKAFCIAGVSYGLFNKHQQLRKGKHKVQLWPIKENDESLDYVAPGKISVHDDELWRIEKLVQEYKRGQVPRVDWLDQITFKQIAERINAQSVMDHKAHMYIEFPAFEHTVVFHERDNPGCANQANLNSETPFIEDRSNRKPHLSDAASAAIGLAANVVSTGAELKFTVVHDPEALRKDNPVENKYLKLMRYNRGLLDKDLKPDQKERNQLKRILNYPTTKQLTAEEKEFLWKFRFYLKNNAAALTKFARCVDWSHRKERKQAMKLISEWEAIEVDHALELLSASFAGINPLRRYAVKRLEEAKDEELLSYLLQLVQALRYEKGFLSDEQILASQTEQQIIEPGLPTKKVSRTRDLPATLRRKKTSAGNVAAKRSLTTASSNIRKEEEGAAGSINGGVMIYTEMPRLAQFLIDRAMKNPKLANFLYWYFTVEATQDQKPTAYGLSYRRTLDHFIAQLGEVEDGQQQLLYFSRQKKLIGELIELYNQLKASGKNVKRKVERLREWLEGYRSFDPFPHPLNPDIIVTGLIPEKASVFGSAMAPFKLVFRTDTGGEYSIIFKCGDDPRQDQLVIQLISLMDSLLKKVKFDLSLTPYGVLAMSCNEGMVEFIPSEPLSKVLAQYGRNIQNFLRQHHAEDTGPFGIERETLDIFIKSLAGYCVITYILGIGDRHNDNLMLRSEGHLFHIDFGFILGADPKIFPPPFKLTYQMVEAMGGEASEEYEQFKSYCCSCFIILRKNANLILNLFSLMVDGDIPGIADLGGEKSILKVQEKFMLDLTDEQAIKEFQDLMKSAVENMWAPLFDKGHDIVQKFK
jgi:phosphatidylinositol 3-kinase